MFGASRSVWATVHQERLRLAEDLTGLAPAQWRTASLCPGWDIQDVLAHLLDIAETGRMRFLAGLAAARFNFDRANDRGVERRRQADPEATLDAFRRAVTLTRTPPANPATRLVEAFVHGEDIRRPLGIAASYPAEAVAMAISYQLRTPVAFGGGRERAAGLRLVDAAGGRGWGQGRVVEADAVEILLAVSGRPARVTGFPAQGS